AHLDLAWNALQWDRNLIHSAHTIRTNEVFITGQGRGQGTVALPELREGRVAVCFATLLARSTGQAAPGIDYPSPTQAYGAARGQLAYYRALEQFGEVRIITGLRALDAHIAEWEVWDATQTAEVTPSPPLGLIISMESADPILRPEDLSDWWEVGVRVIGPAHYGPGRYAGGTGVESALTSQGIALLAEMERIGIILDMTHLSDQAFWQALNRYQGPIIASHNNCRTLVPEQRQFSDQQLRAIIDRNGVIGASLDARMLKLGWTPGTSSNADVPLLRVVDHIDYICQLASNCRHIAIGSDLDGGFGQEQSPRDLDTIADFQKLRDLLAAKGYSSSDVAAILYRNWLH